MAIRYIPFADGEILTANQMLSVQHNGVVQVGTFAELASVNASVNAAYVVDSEAFYVRKGGSWGSVGGLATIQASEPASPQTGQIWFDTDLVLPSCQKVVYAGSETITATSPTATGNLAVVSVVLPEAAWVNVDYGVVDPNNTLTADSVSFAAQLSGATTRAVAATDYATSKGVSQSSVANSFTVIMNAGTTYITGVAKRISSASGTSTISNFYINANPIRWS